MTKEVAEEENNNNLVEKNIEELGTHHSFFA